MNSNNQTSAAKMRISSFLGILLVLAPLLSTVHCDPSKLSPFLSYDLTDFSRQIRPTYGYKNALHMFALARSSGWESSTHLTFCIVTSRAVVSQGRFASTGALGGETALSNFEVVNYPQADRELNMASCIDKTLDELNALFQGMFFERTGKNNASTTLQLLYTIKLKDGPADYDYFAQHLVFSPTITLESMTESAAVMLDPDVTFTVALYQIAEDPRVITNQQVKVHQIVNGDYFLKLYVTQEGRVVLQGRTPTSLPKVQNGRYVTTIYFSLQDKVTNERTPTLVFMVELNPDKMSNQDSLVLYIYGGFLIVFIVAVIGFIVYMVSREEKNKRNNIRKEIQPQENQVHENVLTQSILDWNKTIASTRDQTEKAQSSTLLNSSERFSLKKPKKGNQQYSNLMDGGTNNSKDVTSNQDEGNSIEMADYKKPNLVGLEDKQKVKIVMPSDNRDTGANQQDNEQDPESRDQSAKKANFKLGAGRLLRNNAAPDAKPAVKLATAALIAGSNLEGVSNFSQLELSKIDNLDNTVMRAQTGIEAGNLSKIIGNDFSVIQDGEGGQGGPESPTKGNNDMQGLEDIILKEL